jgi:hypothetical protein
MSCLICGKEGERKVWHEASGVYVCITCYRKVGYADVQEFSINKMLDARKDLEAKLAKSEADVAAHVSDHKIMGDEEVKYREEMNAKLAKAEASAAAGHDGCPSCAAMRGALLPILAEAKERADFMHFTWRLDAHVEMTLTIAECQAVRAAVDSDAGAKPLAVIEAARKVTCAETEREGAEAISALRGRLEALDGEKEQ